MMVTVTSVVAGLAAPVVPVLVVRMDRRWLLAGLMGLMTLANVVSGIAPNLATLMASRALVGVAIGGFWAVAGGLAVRLVTACRGPPPSSSAVSKPRTCSACRSGRSSMTSPDGAGLVVRVVRAIGASEQPVPGW